MSKEDNRYPISMTEPDSGGRLMADRIFAGLFKNTREVDVNYSPQELRVKHIYEDIMSKWLEAPTMTDNQMIEFLNSQYGVRRREAYAYIADVKSVMGNMRNAGREWHRYVEIMMVLNIYQKAEAKNDLKAMARAADLYGKYTQLDKSETQRVDWSLIVPPQFEPTTDVTVLGLEKIGDIEGLRKRLERKYGVLTGTKEYSAEDVEEIIGEE